jgi:hypothetical protein
MTLPQDDGRLQLEIQAREEALLQTDSVMKQDAVRDGVHAAASEEYLRVFNSTFNALPNNDAGMDDKVNKAADAAMRAYTRVFHNTYGNAFRAAFDAAHKTAIDSMSDDPDRESEL